MAKDTLTHLNEKGEARVVDVGDKPATRRRAVASAQLLARPDTVDAIFGGALEKGDALAVARVAGIMAAKKTPDVIPLCHAVALTSVTVEIERGDEPGVIAIAAIAETTDRTGVEMEALVAASTAALTLYDMAKAIDREMTVSQVRLEEKTGGKSGTFTRGDT